MCSKMEADTTELFKLTDCVYYMPGEEETDRPFLYYIKGKDYSVAIDAGNSKKHVECFYNAIKKENMALPKYTVITHWHWDHTFGIPYVHGETIASEQTNQKLKEVSNWEWTLDEMKKRESTGEDISFCNNCIIKEYENLSEIMVKLADITISDNTQLDLGDLKLILIPRDSTHSRDALFIFCPEERMLFVGDADCEDYYEGGGKYNRDKLDAIIHFIESIDFDTYLLGHDMPSNKEEALEYLRECHKNSFFHLQGE